MTMEAPAVEPVAAVAVDGSAEAVEGEGVPTSRWPDPIPEEWKTARAAAAEQWFQKASQQAHRVYRKAQDKADDAKTAAKAKADNMRAQASELGLFEAKQAQLGRHISSSIEARLDDVAMTHSNRQLLTLPHYTAVRPLAVLYWGQAGFKEKLYVRGLVSTLLGNGVASPDAPAPPELVWWELLQPRLGMHDRPLARLEAIQRSRVVLLVLSQGYVTSPDFPAERDLILNRLLDQGPVRRHVNVIVIRFSTDPRVTPPTFPLPIIPAGHQLTVVTLGTTIPPSVGNRDGNSPVYMQVEVDSSRTTKQQILQTVEFIRSVMSLAAGIEMPPEPEVQVYFHPRFALTQSPLNMSASMITTATSLAALPSSTPVDPGASWAAAHQLPSPLGMTKPLEDWSVHDVQIWIRSLGTCFDRYCWGFDRLGVDGWLLTELTDELLQGVLGVDDAGARKVLMERLRLALRQTARLNSTGNLLPPGEDPPELVTMSPVELQQVLEDVFMHYDRDESGDLNPAEVAQVLQAAGLRLSDEQVGPILEEYDVDGDGVLSPEEALTMLRDLWRLVVASRDAATWNIRSGNRDAGPDGDDGAVDEWAVAAAERSAASPSATVLSPGPGGRRKLGSNSGAASGMVTPTGVRLQKGMLEAVAGGHSSEGSPARPRAPVRKSLVAMSTKHRMTMRQGPWAGAISRAPSMAASRVGGGGGVMPWGGAASVVPSNASTENELPRGRSEGGGMLPALVPPKAKRQSQATLTGSISTATAGADSAAIRKEKSSKGILRFESGKPMERAAPVQAQPQVQRFVPGGSSTIGSTVSGGRGSDSGGAARADANAWRRPSTHVSFAAGFSSFRSRAGAGAGARCAPNGKLLPTMTGSCLPPGAASGLATGAASSHGARSLVGTAAAVAELDVFFEAEEGALNLRGTADQGDLSATLRDALVAADLRHSGRVDSQALRNAVGWGLPPGTLSPFELWLLCSLAPTPRPGSGLLGASAADVSIDTFTQEAVEAVAQCQQRLMDVVYSPQGTQQTLWKLYLQLRPLPPGCVTTERGIVVQQRPVSSPGSLQSTGTLSVAMSQGDDQGLQLAPLSSDEAKQLLDIVVQRVLKLPATQKLPLLVQEGILQEALAEVEQCLGSGHELNSWSSITAHMLHVYMSLP